MWKPETETVQDIDKVLSGAYQECRKSKLGLKTAPCLRIP